MVQYRRFRTEDLPALGRLMNEISQGGPQGDLVHPEGRTPTELAEEYAEFEPEQVLWIAEDQGEVIGFAGVVAEPEVKQEAIGWLEGPVVARAWRHRGIGVALLCRSEGDARRLGIERIRQGVNAQNRLGARFLEGHGFVLLLYNYWYRLSGRRTQPQVPLAIGREVRPAALEDVSAVHRLFRQAFPTNLRPEARLAEWIQKEDYLVRALVEQGRIVGFCEVAVTDSHADVEYLGVEETARGAAVGGRS